MNRRVPSRQATQLRLAPLLPILALSACASVLGIEDIQEDPGLPNGGTTTTSAQGGDKNVGGGQSGSANNGGNGGNGNVAGDEAMGGNPPSAGSTSVGEAGMGGVPDPGDPTVRGTLIDFWRTPVPNTPIVVDGQLTTTDKDGQFVVEDVPETYDVSVAFEFGVNATPRYHGYVFQGLKRRNPTIQVRQGFELRYGTVVATPANATLPTGDTIKLAIGGDTGNLSSSMALNGVEKSCYWEGSETAQQTAHALHVTLDQDTDLPTAYKAYDSSLVALSETGESQVSLDLTPETIATGNLVGTAKSGGGTYRTNSVFLRFDSGAAMQLVDDSPGPNSFSYLVPTIPTSTLTVAASEGADDYEGPFAIAYKTDLAATDKPALQIPTPATPVAPAPDITGVTSATSFSFTSVAPGPFVVHFSNVDTTGPYEDLWVVTADKQLTIPEVLNGGFALNANNVHSWNVETHGEFASVDAMAEPEGFWDLFTWEGGPVAPLVDDGSWSLSAARYFTTAP